MSQNRAVTTLRAVSDGRVAASSGAPQAPQNRKPAGLGELQLSQVVVDCDVRFPVPLTRPAYFTRGPT
jgi:hypothetical protein